MADEKATTKRKDGILDDVLEDAVAAFDAQTAAASDEVEVSGIRQAPDAALAVNAQDLQDLLEHARKTGGEALAAKFPHL